MSPYPRQRFLDELERGFRGVLGRSRATVAALTEAKEHTGELARSFGPEIGQEQLIATFLADVLAGLALERDWSDDEVEALLAVAGDVSGESRDVTAMRVFLQTVNHPRLLELPPRLAAETKLRVLLLLPHVTEASVWLWEPTKAFQPLVHMGASGATRSVRAAARRAVFGGDIPPRGLIRAVPILRADQPAAALVLRARQGEVEPALALGRETAIALGAVLDRELLLRRSAETLTLLTRASERRLQRIGLDLHDDPLQGLALLRGDFQLFRRQIVERVTSVPTRDALISRVDDLSARLGAVDATLREMAGSFEDEAFVKQGLEAAIKAEVATLAARASVNASVTIEGDLKDLTTSQRIAVHRIVQEALANVREHSRASEVTVSVCRRRHSIHAEIADNGVGFQVERAVFAAAKRGRLGLIGMSERARLLGGTLGVESRPGGPTTVWVTLLEWRPKAEDAPPSPARIPLMADRGQTVRAAPLDSA